MKEIYFCNKCRRCTPYDELISGMCEDCFPIQELDDAVNDYSDGWCESGGETTQ